jgi:hypothetical protein
MNIPKILRRIGLFLAVSLVITTLWFSGLEVVYARVLVFSTNTVLSVAGSESGIRIEEEDNGYIFRVHRIIDGRQANYPQKFETLLLPTVMILAWLTFSAFYRKGKQVLVSAGTTIGAFLALQIIFLLLLTAYYTSGAAKYFYDVMLDSFYIIAMGIIILDYVREPVLRPVAR